VVWFVRVYVYVCVYVCFGSSVCGVSG